MEEVDMDDNVGQFWRMFDKNLLEAVKRNSYRGTEILLDHERRWMDYLGVEFRREKYRKPLILAAKNEEMQLIKLLLKHDYKLEEPHVSNCKCYTCNSDTFCTAKTRILTMQALSSLPWIALTSEDPFLTYFKLNELCDKYRNEDDSFETVFEKLADDNQHVCLELLDEIETEEESLCILRYKSLNTDRSTSSDLSFIELAIDYEQKEVVAHPVLQHFVASRVFDEIPKWRTSGVVYKVLLIILVGCFYPVTTLLNLILPSSCCEPVGSIALKPFVKFVNGAASFITFLVLLTVFSSGHRAGISKGNSFDVVEVLIFVWLLGFCVGEITQLYGRGVSDYFKNGWNWIDIGMDVLMSFSFITWIILYYYNPDNEDTIRYFADGAFALATILSFFRIVYICQITSYLGLLQLCLGRMVQVIFQFAFISLVVLFSFSVAMVFLFHAYPEHDELITQYDKKQGTKSYIYRALMGNYGGLIPTVITMAWAGLSMKDTDVLEDFEDGTLIQLWANILFIAYFGVSMIVLLNMLIAMMNNSYEHVESNLEIEHKFCRTSLWLEYIGSEQVRCIPFNLIPSYGTVKWLCRLVKELIRGDPPMKDGYRYPTLRRTERKKYTSLCKTLVERCMVKKYGYSIDDEMPVEDPVPENDLFIQKLKAFVDSWRPRDSVIEYSIEEEKQTTNNPTASISTKNKYDVTIARSS